jgi:hypothetical protein
VLGFGGPWDRGGGGERLGVKEAALVEKRMVACLLAHPGPCCLLFLQIKDTWRNFYFLEGTNSYESIDSDDA